MNEDAFAARREADAVRYSLEKLMPQRNEPIELILGLYPVAATEAEVDHARDLLEASGCFTFPPIKTVLTDTRYAISIRIPRWANAAFQRVRYPNYPQIVPVTPMTVEEQARIVIMILQGEET